MSVAYCAPRCKGEGQAGGGQGNKMAAGRFPPPPGQPLEGWAKEPPSPSRHLRPTKAESDMRLPAVVAPSRERGREAGAPWSGVSIPWLF